MFTTPDSKQNKSNLALLGLLGRNIRDRKAQAMLRQFQGSPSIDEYDTAIYYSYRSAGISVMCNKARIIDTIFLYAAGADDFTQYDGELPAGLQWTDTRKDVEAKLGTPQTTGGNGVINYWESYDDCGLAVTYDSLDTSDLSIHIHHLAVFGDKKQSTGKSDPQLSIWGKIRAFLSRK